jgi:hypothetical protein
MLANVAGPIGAVEGVSCRPRHASSRSHCRKCCHSISEQTNAPLAGQRSTNGSRMPIGDRDVVLTPVSRSWNPAGSVFRCGQDRGIDQRSLPSDCGQQAPIRSEIVWHAANRRSGAVPQSVGHVSDMNRAVVNLLTIGLCVSPAEDVVADVNVLGRHVTHERVLSSTPITIASDGVPIEGHGIPSAICCQRHRALSP